MNKFKLWIAAGLATIALGVTGCTVGTGVAATTGTTTTSTTTSTGSTAATTLTADHDSTADHTWDASAEVAIDLSNPAATSGVTVSNGVITITQAGAYRLSGTLADGQVVVDTADSANVYLILDDASITNADGSALAILNAELALVVLPDGTTSTLTDGAGYAATGDDDPDAALYSASDLTILGGGALTVNGKFNDAINSRDGIVIVDGTITVNAVDDGIRGQDYVVVKDGTVNVTATDDGLKSDNEEDTSLGYLSVTDGAVTISSGDDAMHSVNALNISGGTVDITKSVEGLESLNITISGGTTNVVSSDDATNATDTLTGTASGLLTISGGQLTVNSEGDGLDANGSIVMTGGDVVVNGPTMGGNGSLDYDGTFLISGGTLVAAGSSGMAQAPSTTSTQKSLMASVNAAAGSKVEFIDSSGTVVATITTVKQVQNVVVSSPEIKEGETYTVSVNGSEVGTTDTSQAVSSGRGPRR
ncbi:MAG: carbohydrate-binding domain-containing protein [Micropruina sp.]|nr:carbohydrate-binding domain-containing protein [Micropruina sp.]